MNEIQVDGKGVPVDAQQYGAERAAQWVPGVMDRLKEQEGQAFECVICDQERKDAGATIGVRQVCLQCCLEAVRDKLVAQGRAGSMKTVSVPRTRALAANPDYNPLDPLSQKEIETEVPEYVKRHLGVTVRCTAKRCPDPIFRADFDEIVREVKCPNCERPTPTPAAYWGNP